MLKYLYFFFFFFVLFLSSSLFFFFVGGGGGGGYHTGHWEPGCCCTPRKKFRGSAARSAPHGIFDQHPSYGGERAFLIFVCMSGQNSIPAWNWWPFPPPPPPPFFLFAHQLSWAPLQYPRWEVGTCLLLFLARHPSSAPLQHPTWKWGPCLSAQLSTLIAPSLGSEDLFIFLSAPCTLSQKIVPRALVPHVNCPLNLPTFWNPHLQVLEMAGTPGHHWHPFFSVKKRDRNYDRNWDFEQLKTSIVQH